MGAIKREPAVLFLGSLAVIAAATAITEGEGAALALPAGLIGAGVTLATHKFVLAGWPRASSARGL